MASIFTKPGKSSYALLLSLLLVFCTQWAYAQGTRTYADEATYSSPNVPEGLLDFPPYEKETVENPINATVGDDNYARLLASPGLLVGLGAYHGEIELKYPTALPANTTTFIRVDASGDLFGVLLGGSLGELLGDVLGVVALGRQEFTVIARSGGTDVYSRSTVQGFNVERARVIVGADGNYYIAITPNAAYDRIYIENGSLSLLGLGDEVNLDVFSVFNYESASICGNPIGTSFDVSGVDLDLLNLGGSVADDVHLAIDGDESTYSSLSPGLLSVAGTLEQHFYFDGLGQASDEVMVTLSAAPGVLDVDLLSNIDLVVYNGATEVGRQDLETLGSELLGIAQLDLLGLLADGNPVTFTMTPGSAFDRFELEVSTLLNLGTSESLRIHEVKRTPGRPVIAGIDANRNLMVCAGQDVTLSSTVAAGDQVHWYDAPVGGNLLHTGTNFGLGPVGAKETYYAAASRPGCAEESIRVPVTVDINRNPLISLNGAAVYNIAVGESVTLPPATAANEDGSNVPVTWTGIDGAPFMAPNTAGTFSTGGKYTYRVSASGAECTNFVDVVVNVFDPATCPLVFNRRFATSAADFTVSSLLGLQLGAVTDAGLAAGSNMDDYSLISETVGTSLLGLTGETAQTIRWNTMIPAGTPVTLKLGREYGAAGVSGGIYVQALDGDPVNGDELIGVRQVADANLVSAVNGVNEFTYTFIPVDANGVPVAYNGVKVSLASLLNAVQNVRVYGAYYHETSSTLNNCVFGAIDLLTGFESIIGGLDVASGLTSVTDPELAVDDDLSTFAVLNNAVGANISSKLDVTFSAPAIAGDSVFIKVGSTTGLLDLTLLEGYTIQRYLGNQEVGEPLDGSSVILELNLLEDPTEQALTFINDVPFDRLKILSGGVVEAVDNLRVYEIKLIPLTELDGEQHDDGTDVDYIEICPGDLIDLPDSSCDQVKFYSDETGGSEISVEDIAAWAPGTVQTVWLQGVRFGCEEGIDRRPIEIRVNNSSAEILENILVNGVDAGAFCPTGGPVTLEAVLVSGAPSPVTYQWFSDNAGTPEMIAGETAATVELTGLTAGDYTYYVALSTDGYCTADPIPVTFTINRNATDADIIIDDLITQCVGVPVELIPASSVSNPVFSWYMDAAKTTPISDGDTSGGLTYNVSATGKLTISGLTDGADVHYFVTVSGDDVCENVSGKDVNVQVSNKLQAPTFEESAISLCGAGQDAVVTVTNFAGGFTYTLYDAETGGNAVTAGVSVVDNVITIDNVTADATYWVEVSGASGCLGTTRGQLTVTVLPEATEADIEVADGAICAGASGTLAASSTTVSSPIFRWYSDPALTNLLHEGADFTISPAATSTYYVTVQGDGVCENAPGTGKAVTLTVNELPDVPGVSADVNISEGTATLLTASAGDPAPAGIELVWYDEMGTELTVGESYNTGILAQGTYIFFVEARNSLSGCVSGARASVTVTVGPPNPIEDCTIANAQSNGTAAICVLCGVENPNNSVDGNIDTYARFIAPAAVSGAVWQELIFPSSGSAGDTLRITVGSGGSLIDLDLLSGLRFETYNGATSNSDGGVVDGNTIKLRLLDGTDDKAEIVFVAGGNFDRVRVTYAPLAGVLSSGWRIYQAQINYARPTAITDDVVVCEGDAATLSATAGSGTSLRWYDSAVGGTLLADGSSFTTPALNTAGTVTYFLAIVKGTCEDPVRIPVDVVVNPSPTSADIVVTGNESPICADVPVVLTPSVAPGSTLVTGAGAFTWYMDANKTMPINDGDTDGAVTYAVSASGVLTVTGLSAAGNPHTFYVSVIGDNGCENADGKLKEAAVTINRNATDADITLADEITQCVGAPVVLSPSSSVSSAVFTWYYDAAKTNPINDGDTNGAVTYTINASGQLEITGMMDGASESYFVTVSGANVCENITGKEVTVIVSNTLDKPTFNAPDQVVCGAGNDALFVVTNSSGGLTYRLFDAETGGSEVTANVSITNNEVTIENVTADAAYWVEVAGTAGCIGAERTRITVTLNRNATPADIAAMGGTICPGDVFTLDASTSTVTSPVFTWYTDAALTQEITNLDVMPTSTTTYYVTVSGDGVCANPVGQAKAITVTVNRTATEVDIEAAGGSICAGESFLLEAASSTVTSPVFTWYTDAALTNVLADPTVSPSTTTTYYVTVSGDGVCENAPGDAKEVTVIVNRNGTAADINAPGGTICAGDSFELDASSTVAGAVFTWYADAALTTPLTGLEVSPAATTTYYVTVTGEGVCENLPGTARSVTVTVNRNATAADITADGGTICAGESFTLTASSTVVSPVFTWYADASLTSPLAENEVSPSATTTYYVTVSGAGVCENRPGTAKAVTVTVNRNATAADIEVADATICAGDTFVLDASSTTVADPVFTWYADADLMTEITGTEVMPTATTTYYVTVSGDGVCANAAGDAKAVRVTVNRNATAADITADGGTICAGASFTLSASSSTVSNAVFTWYADANLTTPLSDEDVSPSATTTYYVTVVGDGVCENKPGEAKAVTVTVNRNGTSSDITASGVTICAGESHRLSAASTIANAIFRWYTDAALTNELSNLDISPATTTTYYVTVAGEGICENPSGNAKAITITVNRKATAADIEADGGAVCAGSSFTLRANSAIGNSMFTWYTDAALTNELTDLEVRPSATTTYYVTVSGDGVCANAPGDAKEVTVTVNNPPAPTTNSTEQSFCGTSGGTIADLQVNESSIVWYDAATGGNQLGLSEAVVEGMTYYAAFLDTNTGCESSERLAIKVADCAHLEVTKTTDVTSAVIGQLFTYTISITNEGAVPAMNVVAVDEVPAELQPIEASANGTISGNSVTWQIAEIGAGETIQLTLSVMAMSESNGIINRVEVDSDNSDPDEDETDPIPVYDDDVDLSLEKLVSSSAIEIGGQFTYQLRITNKSDVPAINVMLIDYLPVQVRYLGSNAGGGISESYDPATRELTFVIAEIAAQSEMVIDLRVEATEEGLVTNSASVETENQTDPFEADNTATVSHDQFEITIPNVFSPNGDGKNDTWEIEGLTELYPDNEVIIVNRWGGEVFKSSNYKNDWDGGSLDEGTYFYKVKIRSRETGRETTFTGYVTILR